MGLLKIVGAVAGEYTAVIMCLMIGDVGDNAARHRLKNKKMR